jgi:hypothetical protein
MHLSVVVEKCLLICDSSGYAINGGRGFVLHSCHSEVRADITIPIRRIIIQIPIERACIRAIIRITAEMHDAGIPCENPSDP